MRNRSAICVLGGMGPQASVYMYRLLIEMSVRDFGAKNNDDFPEIILHAIPIPDFISNGKERGAALEMLKKRVRQLNNLNISSFSIACNTVYVLLKDLQKVSKIPFVSIIDEVIKQVRRDKKSKVGLLGMPSLVKSNMYQSKLNDYRIEVVVPANDQLLILESISRNVIRGKIGNKDSKVLIGIADSLKSRGAEGIILGCTELPLVFPKKYSLPVYNSVEILARALLRKYYK